MSFPELIWSAFTFIVLLSYLSLLFFVLADAIRNSETRRWTKLTWIILLVFVPFFTAFAYLLVHGQTMALRNQVRNDSRPKSVRQSSNNDSAAIERIRVAKSMLDEGAITAKEFQQVKEHKLSHLPSDTGRPEMSPPIQ